MPLTKWAKNVTCKQGQNLGNLVEFHLSFIIIMQNFKKKMLCLFVKCNVLINNSDHKPVFDYKFHSSLFLRYLDESFR